MSRGLVSVKPFIKKKKKKGLKWFFQHHKISLPKFSFSLSNTAKRIIMWSFISIVLLVVGFYFLIKKVFLKEEFIISKVEFSEQSIASYEDIELFDFLSKSLQGKNYYEFQYFLKGSLLAKAQQITPFLENIDYQLMTGNTL